MTSLKIAASALALMLVAAASAVAQPASASPGKGTRVQWSIGGLAGAAVGDFGKNVGASGGLSIGLDFGLDDSIVSVGGEGSYIIYGMDSRTVDLGPAIPELAGTTVTVSNDNAMFLLHGRVRVQPHRGRWRPYADALAGFNYIYTTTSLDQSTSCSGTSCGNIERTNLDDLAPSVGVGAGLMVALGSSPGAARLDLSVRYLRGGAANYLKKGAIHNENGVMVLDVSRSRIDTVVVNVGLAFGR